MAATVGVRSRRRSRAGSGADGGTWNRRGSRGRRGRLYRNAQLVLIFPFTDALRQSRLKGTQGPSGEQALALLDFLEQRTKKR